MVVYYREMMPGCVTPLTGSVFGRAVDFATTVSPWWIHAYWSCVVYPANWFEVEQVYGVKHEAININMVKDNSSCLISTKVLIMDFTFLL